MLDLSLFGIKVIEDPRLTVFFRFPRSKKKRIRDKWAKNPRNKRPDTKIYTIGTTAYCHPQVARELRKHLIKE